MSLPSSPLRLVFLTPPLGERLRRRAAHLLRVAPILLILAALPFGVYRLTGEADPRLNRFGAYLGLAMLAILVVCSLLEAAVVRPPPRTITFDERTIVEEVGERRQERTWSWIRRATENARELAIVLQPETQRSFRLTAGRPGLLFLDKSKVSPAEIARVRALLVQRKLLHRDESYRPA